MACALAGWGLSALSAERWKDLERSSAEEIALTWSHLLWDRILCSLTLDMMSPMCVWVEVTCERDRTMEKLCICFTYWTYCVGFQTSGVLLVDIILWYDTPHFHLRCLPCLPCNSVQLCVCVTGEWRLSHDMNWGLWSDPLICRLWLWLEPFKDNWSEAEWRGETEIHCVPVTPPRLDLFAWASLEKQLLFNESAYECSLGKLPWLPKVLLCAR